jgi:hypothetical protein
MQEDKCFPKKKIARASHELNRKGGRKKEEMDGAVGEQEGGRGRTLLLEAVGGGGWLLQE